MQQRSDQTLKIPVFFLHMNAKNLKIPLFFQHLRENTLKIPAQYLKIPQNTLKYLCFLQQPIAWPFGPPVAEGGEMEVVQENTGILRYFAGIFKILSENAYKNN